MKKRDIFIMLGLIAVVVAFTVWETVINRDKEMRDDRARQSERMQLEGRLARYDLHLDSLSTRVLRLVDSLKIEAAAFESLAARTQLAVDAGQKEAEVIPPRAEEVAPPDTIPSLIRVDYEKAMAAMPYDLTKYERKIAKKEVESTILAKYSISLAKFGKIKKTWRTVAGTPGD